jgi:allantoinase
VWTKAREKNISLNQIAKWLCENPAKFIGLENTKGKIQKDFDADIVIWNTDKKFIVEESNIQHRHKITPYLKKELFGVVEQTYIGGIKVYNQGKFLHLNEGKILLS